ncbi:uncharacterized protein LOC117178409 [Belonocnema kinseyi]|uniref:uncharacterized protein LOC117178409 n=1 Tax=Belonocnema kinseyi TaxID=2817044 RepID=UPI00143DD930|nr:uncharacterized protein LOC117178409 [Belonocnema kinseyi]
MAGKKKVREEEKSVKLKPEAVIIKSADRKTYSQVLGKIQGALGENNTVQNIVAINSLEIRNLDSYTTREEPETALKRDLKKLSEQPKVTVSKPNRRGQSLVVIELSAQAANKLLRTEHIKIGWVNCHVRRRIPMERCFNCLWYGHQSRNCKGPNRRHVCFKCATNGHKGARCNAEVQCVLCEKRKLPED